MNFAITKDGILNLNVQVVSTGQQLPEDFGYVSFGVKVVESDFSISVFAMENNHMTLTSAVLSLYKGNEKIYMQNLPATTNPVNFKGDPNATYTLLIEKEGFTLKSKTYVLHNLLAALNGSPLTITLEPASSLILLAKDSTKLELRIATPGDVYIDWGDGMVERAIIPPGDYRGTLHRYNVPGRYFVNITGDLNSITGFSFLWFQFEIEKSQRIETVDITRLTELKQYSLTWHKDTPAEIDFSHNTKLEHLDVQYSSLTKLDISNNSHLKLLYIMSIPLLSNSNLSEFLDVVDNVSSHAMANNIHNGVFSFDPLPINAVPDDAKMKLINLKQNYDWEIFPSPN